jgi:esterase/lipase superfamily enzyme
MATELHHTTKEQAAHDARPCRLLAVLALGMLLSACGHRADVMKPVAVTATDTGRVDMLVATTRAPSADPAVRYGGERGEDVRLDNIVVSIPPDSARKPGEVQWPGEKPDPEKSFVVTKAESLTDPQAMQWFQRTSGKKRRVLIFVHGFNNSYADAVFRFAQVAHDVKVDAAPLLFTWPSRANPLDYVYDRESTIYSRFGLVSLLDAAAKSTDVADITILAHSMGTWLTMEALREMALRNGKVSPKIHNVVLASPDIDVDVFRRQILEMGDKRPHFTVYASRKDKALALSTFLAGDVDRLGGADLRPYKDLLTAYGISVIDATDATQSDPLGHSAFAESSDMLNSLTARLSQQRLETAPPSLGAALVRGGYAAVKGGLRVPAEVMAAGQ